MVPDLYSLEANQVRLKGGNHRVHHPSLPLPVSSLQRLFVAAISAHSDRRAIHLDVLDIHWHTTFPKDDGDVSDLFPSIVYNIPNLGPVVDLDAFTPVQGVEDEHALGSAPIVVINLPETALGHQR
jgi:hypothetical protein